MREGFGLEGVRGRVSWELWTYLGFLEKKNY